MNKAAEEKVATLEELYKTLNDQTSELLKEKSEFER
jgi:hypothetical protein